MVLLAAFLSPAILAVMAALVVLFAKVRGLQKPTIAFLVGRSLLYGGMGAVVSLVLTVAWMVWYEWSSGYSAGNGPLGWIFFYGPLSAALGQVVAIAQWWFGTGV
jgi:hypothetical protein